MAKPRLNKRAAKLKCFPVARIAAALAGALLAFAPTGSPAQDSAVQYVAQGTPAPECAATRPAFGGGSLVLPGYRVREGGGEVCLPFSYRAAFAPAGYEGDYFVDEFMDAKLKAAYASCRADAACADLFNRPQFAPPGHQYRATGAVNATGRIDPNGAVDLRAIRRPQFFAQAPYQEPIAEAETRTYTVEFTAPAEPYERLHLNRTDPVRLRGWYLEGVGFDGGAGRRLRALVVLIGGRSVETTASDWPGEIPGQSFPSATTEQFGASVWRNSYVHAFNRAGFDVLTFDKRGHGISGGYNDTDTLEQGRDMLRAIAALDTGEGLRLLTPDGRLLEGRAAGGRLLAGMSARQIPIILGGSSQGSMTTTWAMHANFVGDCSYNLAQVPCAPPLGYNVRGALLLASFEGGVGNSSAPADVHERAISEGRLRAEFNIATLPSSEPFAHIDRWPAVFFGRGSWDFAEALEATYASYRRVRGLREIVVVRGGHSEVAWGRENVAYMVERMIAFSKAATVGALESPGAAQFSDLRELVLSSRPTWEPGEGAR